MGGGGEQGEAAREGLLGGCVKVKFHSKSNAEPWMVFFLIYLFFMFGCVGSSLLCAGFL